MTDRRAARRGRRPDLPLPPGDRARDPRPVADGRARRGHPRGRAVGLRQEHAHPGHQRAHPARVPGRAHGRRPRRRPADDRAEAARHRADRRARCSRTRPSRSSGRPWSPSSRSARRTWVSPRSEIRDRIRDVAVRAGIEPMLGRETAALSGGERQLLAMAGILMMRPRLYVVDEPLANLDPATAERLLDVLRDLADRGDAIVIVEHRVEEALELRPDRVLYLEDGRQRYLGPVDGFLADRRSRRGQAAVRRRARAGSRNDGRERRIRRGAGGRGPVSARTRSARSADATSGTPPRLEFRGVRRGDRRPRDPAWGRCPARARRDRCGPRAERLGQDDRCSGPRCTCSGSPRGRSSSMARRSPIGPRRSSRPSSATSSRAPARCCSPDRRGRARCSGRGISAGTRRASKPCSTIASSARPSTGWRTSGHGRRSRCRSDSRSDSRSRSRWPSDPRR